ncbi:MAG: exodeoxyribonuclease VII small subunit, partial [Spirochaetaceae bacterium]|nr:exodeoxyribonuclease VII small subunit [Spirochaetaceae bacterium]
MKSLEDELKELEEISDSIKDPQVSLEDALALFEKGIALSRSLEKRIDKIDGKVQMLMNGP